MPHTPPVLEVLFLLIFLLYGVIMKFMVCEILRREIERFWGGFNSGETSFPLDVCLLHNRTINILILILAHVSLLVITEYLTVHGKKDIYDWSPKLPSVGVIGPELYGKEIDHYAFYGQKLSLRDLAGPYGPYGPGPKRPLAFILGWLIVPFTILYFAEMGQLLEYDQPSIGADIYGWINWGRDSMLIQGLSDVHDPPTPIKKMVYQISENGIHKKFHGQRGPWKSPNSFFQRIMWGEQHTQSTYVLRTLEKTNIKNCQTHVILGLTRPGPLHPLIEFYDLKGRIHTIDRSSSIRLPLTMHGLDVEVVVGHNVTGNAQIRSMGYQPSTGNWRFKVRPRRAQSVPGLVFRWENGRYIECLMSGLTLNDGGPYTLKTVSEYAKACHTSRVVGLDQNGKVEPCPARYWHKAGKDREWNNKWLSDLPPLSRRAIPVQQAEDHGWTETPDLGFKTYLSVPIREQTGKNPLPDWGRKSTFEAFARRLTYKRDISKPEIAPNEPILKAESTWQETIQHPFLK